MTARPLILLSNDDGIHAAGLRALARALDPICELYVVAPEREQSASSHRITLSGPLRHHHLGANFHAVDGTPADCIYVALILAGLLPRRPDLVVSGINHGPNLGADVIYSGTVAAAREGALRGIRAIALSAESGADLDRVADHARHIVERTLAVPTPLGAPLLLNVNYPREVPRGVLATRLGRRDYADVVEVRTDPRGRSYYWIGGPVTAHDGAEGADTTAVDRGYVSITPLALEMTNHVQLEFAAQIAGSAETVARAAADRDEP